MGWRRRILRLEKAMGSMDRAAAMLSSRDNAPVKFSNAADRRSRSWKPGHGFRERKRMPLVSDPDWGLLAAPLAMYTAVPDTDNHTLPRQQTPADTQGSRCSRLRFDRSRQQRRHDASRHSILRQDHRRLAFWSGSILPAGVHSPQTKGWGAFPPLPAP